MSLLSNLNNANDSLSRRRWLREMGLGFGSLALSGMLADQTRANVLAPKVTHFPARAKRVIFLFMQGGQSQMDLFDPKPQLRRRDGQPVDRKNPKGAKYKGSPFTFRHCGESGLQLSRALPHLGLRADELCLIRSMHTDSANHSNAMLAFHTGAQNFVRPSIGSWVVYGLGVESQSLPGFISIRPTSSHGSRMYSNAFLPALCQGVALGHDKISAKDIGVANLKNQRWSQPQQRQLMELSRSLNARHRQSVGPVPEVDGLIQTYERAFRMQTEASKIFDLADEPQHVLDFYGVGRKTTDEMARMCILARRFAEAGVRYIQVNHAGWDHHSNIDTGIAASCERTDQPIGALLADLNERGMLDDTLVVSCGEFGRTPVAEGPWHKAGRQHNSQAFTVWMAGGGARGGYAHGATDELGAKSVADRVHIHDLHATMLHLLGLDHERLTYHYSGRDFRLTDVHGEIVHPIIA